MFVACDSGPRVIESDSNKVNVPPSFKDAPGVNDPTSESHKVMVEEVLNTSRYSYLNVTEDGNKFWIAVSSLLKIILAGKVYINVAYSGSIQ